MSVELRRPSATVTWPLGGEISSDMVSVAATINRNTEVSFTAYSGTEASQGANPVFSGEAAQLMGRAQQIGMSRRTSGDCSINMSDGAGHSLNFRGFLAGPSYVLTDRSVVPSFSFLNEGSMIGNLKLDIYNSNSRGKNGESKELSPGTDILQEAVKDGNVADRLKSLTQKMIEFWQGNKPADTNPLMSGIADRRHQINQQGPLNQWYKLLSDSSGKIGNDWLGPLSARHDFNVGFNNEILAILRGTSRDFMDVIESIMGSFQYILVPSKDGGPGSFLPIVEMITGEASDLALPAKALFLNGTSKTDLLPVQQVLMKMTPAPTRDVGEFPAALQINGQSVIGGFPEEPAGASGDVIFEDPPFYINRVIYWTGARGDGGRKGPGAAPPDYRKIKAGLNGLVQNARKFQNQMVSKLVTDYCKNIYADRAMGSNSTQVQIPMDLSLWPGKRYRVTNSNGDALFSGFLSGVNHQFSSQGGSGNASTSLTFTHILFPGFTLPGL